MLEVVTGWCMTTRCGGRLQERVIRRRSCRLKKGGGTAGMFFRRVRQAMRWPISQHYRQLAASIYQSDQSQTLCYASAGSAKQSTPSKILTMETKQTSNLTRSTRPLHPRRDTEYFEQDRRKASRHARFRGVYTAETGLTKQHSQYASIYVCVVLLSIQRFA